MDGGDRGIDRAEPGLVAAGAEQQPRRLQDDGDDRVEDGDRDGKADQHRERMATARLEEIFYFLRRGEQAGRSGEPSSTAVSGMSSAATVINSAHTTTLPMLRLASCVSSPK